MSNIFRYNSPDIELSRYEAGPRSTSRRYVLAGVFLVAWLGTILSVISGFASQQGELERQENSKIKWGEAYATPGVTLHLRETRRAVARGSTVIFYDIVAEGLPADKVYGLWFRDTRLLIRGSDPMPINTGNYADGIRIDESGRFVPRLPIITLTEYVKTQWYELGMISTDGTVRAFATAIPFPVEGRDGQCRVWLSLITADTFVAQGEGFEPGSRAAFVLRSSGKISQISGNVSAEGKFVSVVNPAAGDVRGGLATYSVTGTACAMNLDFEWGTALKVQ